MIQLYDFYILILLYPKEHFKPNLSFVAPTELIFDCFPGRTPIWYDFWSILACKSDFVKFMCMVQLYNCYILILLFSKKHIGPNLRVLAQRIHVIGFYIRQNPVFLRFRSFLALKPIFL